MNTDKTTLADIRRNLWLVGLISAALLLSSSTDAAPRKPKRQEPAPEVTAQVLEKRLADETLTAQDRSSLSVALARTYHQLKDFEREAEVLEDALAAGIKDTTLAGEADYYLGRTYEALGKNESAIDEFLTVWKQYPDCAYRPHAGMELGDLTLLASNTVEATEWYQAVVDFQPKGKLGFLARDKLRAMAKGVSAEEITDESHRPVFEKDQIRRLDQYLYSQLYDKADALARQLTTSATNAQLRAAMSYHLAHHYWMYGDVEGADRFLDDALGTTGSRHGACLILAGHVKRALGQTDAALKYYQQAIAAAPAKEMTITAYQQSTRLLSKSGREADALAVAAAGRQAFTGKPELAAYLNRIANTLRDRADLQWKDYAAQTAATATNEVARRALMLLARDARTRGDWSAAEQFYQQLLSRPTGDWRSGVDMQVRLLEAQLRQSNLSAATVTEGALLAAAKNQPETVQAYVLYRLGKIWQANGRSDKAENGWSQIHAQYPATRIAGMAEVQLARLYESRGDLASAVSMYEAFLKNAETVPRYQLRAYANLFRLKDALGDPVSASSMLDSAKALALQTNDAELELSLAQYFLQRSDRATAKQLLDAGVANVEVMIRTEKSAQKRLWWEYLITRRLDDFQEYGRLADRAAKLEPGLLQNPLLDASMRNAMYCYLMRALEVSGRWPEAEALCQQAIQATPEDSMRLAHVLYRLAQQARNRGESSKVRQFALDAFREVPTSYISQYMYLHLAVEDFNAGRYADALSKTADLEQAVPVSSLAPPGWRESFRWDCQYVKGRCLKSTGTVTIGQQLVTEAIANKSSLAATYPLQEPSTPLSKPSQ